jgi:hypothetical protein
MCSFPIHLWLNSQKMNIIKILQDVDTWHQSWGATCNFPYFMVWNYSKYKIVNYDLDVFKMFTRGIEKTNHALTRGMNYGFVGVDNC